jgi:hypothetical protein
LLVLLPERATDGTCLQFPVSKLVEDTQAIDNLVQEYLVCQHVVIVQAMFVFVEQPPQPEQHAEQHAQQHAEQREQ